MAARSTRNKLMWQVLKSAEKIDLSIEHLAKAEEMADGRHKFIVENLPQVVVMLEGVRTMLLAFREKI